MYGCARNFPASVLSKTKILKIGRGWAHAPARGVCLAGKEPRVAARAGLFVGAVFRGSVGIEYPC